MSYRVSPESFTRVAHALYGMTLKESQALLYQFNEFTRGLDKYNWNETDKVVADIGKAMEIADRCLLIQSETENMHSIDFYCQGYEYDHDKICVFTKTGDRINRHEFQLTNPETYRIVADMLKVEGQEVICIVSSVDTISASKRGYVDENLADRDSNLTVYDGDIFVTYNESSDSFRNRQERNGVYVAIDGAYRRLLYTEKRGYVNSKLDPNIADDGDESNEDVFMFDEHKFTDYVLKLGHKWTRIGNIHVDIDCLMEKKLKKD